MIPGNPPIPDQEFFTMGAACRVAQVAPYTLRYWESRLGMPRPARRSSGHRRYNRSDLETIFEIKRLLSGRRMTLAGARKALWERRRGVRDMGDLAESAAAPAAVKLLREVRSELKELASELAK